jgi:hypothetical protein
MILKKSALLAVPLAALFAVAAVAGPAAAATQSGFRSCSVNYVVKLATITSGFTSVSVNTWHDSATLGTNYARNWYSNQQGGNWSVTAPSVAGASASCG